MSKVQPSYANPRLEKLQRTKATEGRQSSRRVGTERLQYFFKRSHFFLCRRIFPINLARVLKWLKFVIAILLLPVCAGAAMALGAVLRLSGGADTTWVPFLGGVACWCVIFFLLPKPMLIYVLGHELTHALWAWLFGGRLKKMKVSSKGGHVIVTKSNFLIMLAPYFFPLYAVMVIAVFAIGDGIWGWERLFVFFNLLLGAAYAFHVTLTIHALQTQQSDITSQGYLFSGVVIFLGNITILLFGIPWLTDEIAFGEVFHIWLMDIATVLHWLQKLV